MSLSLPPTYYYTSVELVWVFISPIIVLWDVAYVLLRPLSMSGGSLHRPLWIPYELYGKVDYLYGIPALERGDGLVSAFAIINLVESILYVWCAWKLYREGKTSFAHEGSRLLERYFEGRVGNKVLLVMFATSLTVGTKTILYALNEIFSNFANVGHNSWIALTAFWILPNLPWILVPGRIVYTSGRQILEGMSVPVIPSAREKAN